MKKRSCKRVVSRGNSRKKCRKSRRRRGGAYNRTRTSQHGITRTVTTRTPDGEPIPVRAAYPEYLNNQMFLLNARGNIHDMRWGRAWQGDIFGPPVDPEHPSETMVLGEVVKQGTRVTFYNLLHNGYAVFNDDWYPYIEVAGRSGNAPQRFYVSNGTTIERCKEVLHMSDESHRKYITVSGAHAGRTCSNPLRQPVFYPVSTFPPPPGFHFNPDAYATGKTFGASWSRKPRR